MSNIYESYWDGEDLHKPPLKDGATEDEIRERLEDIELRDIGYSTKIYHMFKEVMGVDLIDYPDVPASWPDKKFDYPHADKLFRRYDRTRMGSKFAVK